MKRYKSYVDAAVSAILCGSLATGGLFLAAKAMPEQSAAGYDETTAYHFTETTMLTDDTGEEFTDTTDVTGGDFTDTTTCAPEETTCTATSTSNETGAMPPGSLDASGMCGITAQYNYDRMTYTLNITGRGRVDFNYFTGSPGFRTSEFAKVNYIVIDPGITGIASGTFSDWNSLREISLPDTLEVIGENAFAGCGSLSEVTIPDSVTLIGKCAFSGCSSLASVQLPEKLQTMDSELFRNCGRLSDVQIQNKVKTVGKNVFNGCKSLVSLTLPDSVNMISSNAFQDCTSLLSLSLPYNLRTTGECMFKGCTSLKKLTVLSPDCSLNEEGLNGCVLYGYNKSTAQAFAAEKGLKFESIGEIPVPYPTLGDFNGDGVSDILDAQLVLICYAEDAPHTLSRPDFRAADIDNNGTITALDAQNIMVYYLMNTIIEEPTEWSDIVKEPGSTYPDM